MFIHGYETFWPGSVVPHSGSAPLTRWNAVPAYCVYHAQFSAPANCPRVLMLKSTE